MFDVVTQIKDSAWLEIGDVEGFVEKTILQASSQIDFMPKESEVCCSIVLASDAFVKELNIQYRKKDSATNVLSFANYNLKEDSGLEINHEFELGDIIIAFETIALEAKDQSKEFADHFRHILVHGFLHLIGFDHEVSNDALEMEAKEIAILANMGITNPYL